MKQEIRKINKVSINSYSVVVFSEIIDKYDWERVSRLSLLSFKALFFTTSLLFGMGVTGSEMVHAADIPNLTVSITEPAYKFNVLPGSVRRIYATVTNGVTNGVSWSVNNGATLSSAIGPYVDVTAPAMGSSCQFGGTGTDYTVTSNSTFTITATSQDDDAKSASIVVNICNPEVEVNIVPFYTTLYVGQKAYLQAFVWGAVNRNVTWAIDNQPSGGNGTISDNSDMDTVFSATVAGRYTLSATSVADDTKTTTATVYVTGHTVPYNVTPAKTIPVDCSVDPQLSGTVYEVGPSQIYQTIQSVPWPTLTAGSTVRIHNEDQTGTNPTAYHEYFQLKVSGTRTQPIRVCGVPDAQGNLPVIDGQDATGRSDVSTYSAGYALAGLGSTGWAGVYAGTYSGPQYQIVEGLKFQNAKNIYSYTVPGTSNTANWLGGAACIRIHRGMDFVVRGNDINNCGNGIMAMFNATNGYTITKNTLYEGNHMHNNGNAGAYLEHQLYIQGLNQLTQFNLVDDYTPGANGSNLKSRGFPDVIRYNHFGDGALRQLDLIDNEDASQYVTFNGFLSGGTSSHRYIYPADQYTPDLLAAAMEAHHVDYVYGNTFTNSKAAVPIHYTNDHGSKEGSRLGTLWFYNNSLYEPDCTAVNCGSWRWYLFDTSSGGGNDVALTEWPQIQVHNNAIWMDNPTKPYFFWNNRATQFTTFGKNVINTNWGTNNMAGGDGSGWSPWASQYAYMDGANLAAHTSGAGNLTGVDSVPFDTETFVAGQDMPAGLTLPVPIQNMPVRFQYGPQVSITARSGALAIGAMDSLIISDTIPPAFPSGLSVW